MSEIRTTACSRDCPDACTIEATIEDGRVVALRGGRDDPVTKGFLCERTSKFLSRQYSPDRLTRPMLRRDGELRPIEWDEALDFAASKLLAARDEFGPASILHYQSGGSLGVLKILAAHLFESFGPCTIKRGDICSGAGEAAQEADFGISDSNDLFDLENSRAIVLWGKNPHVSSPHLLPILLAAKKRGVRIIGMDPIRTKAHRLCDLFLFPRPGGDFDLAMGFARRLFERHLVDRDAPSYCDGFEAYRDLVHSKSIEEWSAGAGVPADELRRAADIYGENAPAAILVGWGMARRENGGAVVRAVDALAAVSGNLGIPGGGSSFYYARRAPFDLDFVKGQAAAPRTLSEARLGEEILAASQPPVRAVWVTAGNPVSMLPASETVRQALARTDFVCVVETHPTDTTDCADLVLPTLTLLEDSDVLGAYGSHFLRVSEPVIEPPEGPRHEVHILQGLAERFGVADALAGSVAEWKRRVTRRLDAAGVSLDDMRRGPVRSPFAPKVLFEGRRFSTPSGRMQLITDAPVRSPWPTDERPLLLLAVSTPKAQSSQWAGEVPDGPPEVRVHPVAAGGLADGALAVLESGRTALEVTVRLDDEVRPDVAVMSKGGMLRDDRCANRLVMAVETDIGGGAAYYDEPVRLVAR